MQRRSLPSSHSIPRGTLAGLTVLILVAFAFQASLGTIKPGTIRTLGEDSGTTSRQVVQSQHQHVAKAVRRQTIRPVAATLARNSARARAWMQPTACSCLGASVNRRALLHGYVDLPPPMLA